jgi:hypothetical protein
MVVFHATVKMANGKELSREFSCPVQRSQWVAFTKEKGAKLEAHWVEVRVRETDRPMPDEKHWWRI